jgi:hypothetical protein
MSRYLFVQTPKAGPVGVEYNDNAGLVFKWSWINLKDSEKDDAVMWLHDEGWLEKLSGTLLHNTMLDKCITEDLINSIKELEYNEN